MSRKFSAFSRDKISGAKNWWVRSRPWTSTATRLSSRQAKEGDLNRYFTKSDPARWGSTTKPWSTLHYACTE
jgi:hypothetical protein